MTPSKIYDDVQTLIQCGKVQEATATLKPWAEKELTENGQLHPATARLIDTCITQDILNFSAR